MTFRSTDMALLAGYTFNHSASSLRAKFIQSLTVHLSFASPIPIIQAKKLLAGYLRMLQDSCVDLLACQTLFAGAKMSTLETIVQAGSRYVFGPSMPVILANSDGTGAHLIVEGTATLATAEWDRTYTEYGPGSLLAPMCMFVATTYDSTVVATGKVDALEIPRSVMKLVLQLDPGLAQQLAQRIEGNLGELAGKLKLLEAELSRNAIPESLSEQSRQAMGDSRKAVPAAAPNPEFPLIGMVPTIPASLRSDPVVAAY